MDNIMYGPSAMLGAVLLIAAVVAAVVITCAIDAYREARDARATKRD